MAFQSGYKTILAEKLDPAITSMKVAVAPTATSGRLYLKSGSQEEWINYTGVSGTTLTGLTRQLSTTADPSVSTGDGYTWIAGTVVRLVGMHDQMFDAGNGGTIGGDTDILGNLTLEGDILVDKLDFKLEELNSNFRIRKDLDSMKFRDNETAEVSLKQLAEGNGADQYFAISENDTTVGHFEDKVVSGTGITQTKNNPGGNETITVAVDTSVIATQDYVDGAIVPPNALTNSDRLAGEDMTQGNSMFVEEAVTFASSTNVQNIGDVTANTRVAIRAIGSGTAANTLKLALKKFVSPSVNLGIRIETDNAGSPSGTLVDANATATVLASGLTTSLADITATLAGSITIPKGDVVRLVLFAGTYGSETVNGTNYFGVGYNSNNTTTRYGKLFDGYLYGTTQDDDTITNSTLSSGTGAAGYRLQAKSNIIINRVIKGNSVTATRAIIKNDGGTVLETAIFTGDIAIFTGNTSLNTNDYFRIEIDNSGVIYNQYYNSSPGFPKTGTNIIYNTGSVNGANNANSWNIDSIITTSGDGADSKFYYNSSSLFETSLLSKTDADYTYKLPDIPRIATADYSAGDLVKYDFQGITKALTGLTKDSNYYISNTPGALSTSAGTNKCKLGISKNTDELLLGKKVTDYPITVGASPFTYTNNTGGPIQVKTTGGTVSDIKIRGITIATATSNIANLAEGDSIVVTYSSTPTMAYSDL